MSNLYRSFPTGWGATPTSSNIARMLDSKNISPRSSFHSQVPASPLHKSHGNLKSQLPPRHVAHCFLQAELGLHLGPAPTWDFFPGNCPRTANGGGGVAFSPPRGDCL